MLEHARIRVPAAEFRLGELTALPVGDHTVDIVVCALALTHVSDLRPVFAEFARVLKPGGDLVVADVHAEHVLLGSVPRMVTADGRRGVMPGHRHRAGDYLRAALPAGLVVRRCEEPLAGPQPPAADGLGEVAAGSWQTWPWSLLEVAPAAARAVFGGSPVTVVWHFTAP